MKALLRLSKAGASQHGRVLTYAANKKMTARRFGTELKESGIQRLATRAAAEFPVKPRSVKKTKAKAPHPPGSGTGGTKKATYSPAGQSGSRSDSPSDSRNFRGPELEWAEKAQGIWDDAEPGSRLRLLIEKESDDAGSVLRAKCLEDA